MNLHDDPWSNERGCQFILELLPSRPSLFDIESPPKSLERDWVLKTPVYIQQVRRCC